MGIDNDQDDDQIKNGDVVFLRCNSRRHLQRFLCGVVAVPRKAGDDK